MELILSTILNYFLGLAVNLRSDAIASGLGKELQEQFKRHQDSISKRSLREDLNAACVKLARDQYSHGMTPQKEALLNLLNDGPFQMDLYEWLVAGDIVEGEAAKIRLRTTMGQSLTETHATAEQIEFLETRFFETLDKAVFANPVLAHWRHQLSLDYLRGQVATLREYAAQAAGQFTPEQQKVALDLYCDKELARWDIIDLNNLPEGDSHLATQKLLLRQLYMPLFIEVESTQHDGDAPLDKLEEKRDARRHREAGRLLGGESDSTNTDRSPVGTRLGLSHRLVVLGEPGGGKTTLLRWMATAYLLRDKDREAFNQLPDTDTLPEQPWIPVLIRCRDLGEADLCRCFKDFLTQHLNKTELQPNEARIMGSIILDRIAQGKVLLAVDGLDEIASPRVRMLFCQELERTAARYPETPIIVTSRIVGYRNMPYRMGAGFEHGVIADLDREDKDLFAQRWVQVTEQHPPANEQEQRIQELREALHSSTRIERLTGNPMLLTTLALVKRKVGKLPTRRTKLYAEAVSVLLNWNPRFYDTIDEKEAIPQLEYLAFEMCRRGVQRMEHDEVLDLLDKLRAEYPNIRPIRQRTPEAFLKLLEERSSILIMSGAIWHKETPQGQSAWEFRHLTFQEYLAARALLDGRYPDRDKSKSLAEQVGPLAGQLEKSQDLFQDEEEKVVDAWHEAMRLLVADCQDDNVDEVLCAILEPIAGEDPARSARPRAVLAALCLADEPNVSEKVAQQVLKKLATTVNNTNDGFHLQPSTLVEKAALEVGRSSWSEQLKEVLIEEYCRRPEDTRINPGNLWGSVGGVWKEPSGAVSQQWIADRMVRLKSTNRTEIISAALEIVDAVDQNNIEIVGELSDTLLGLLERQNDFPANYAAALALEGLCEGYLSRQDKTTPIWIARGNDLYRLDRALNAIPKSEGFTRFLLIDFLCQSDDPDVFPLLLARLNDSNTGNQLNVIKALGRLGDKQAVAALIPLFEQSNDNIRFYTAIALINLGDDRGRSIINKFLDHDDPDKRENAVEALAQIRDKTEQELLSLNIDGLAPWIDPREPITDAHIEDAAKRIGKSPQEVREIYESVAEDFHLKFG